MGGSTAGTADAAAMRRAVVLATAGLATTTPNPSVGAVVLDAAGRPVGEGRTQPPPGQHAEVQALAAAGERARGGTMVVTLEPCAHSGRTGPCTSALLAAGVRRVVYALADPDPAAGGGAQLLAAAGVEVAAGLLAAEASRVTGMWCTAVRLGRPFVTLKLATSLDGRAAAADGTSQWITSAQSRADAHRLRAQTDAVLAGVGTVLADNPSLTARRPDGSLLSRQPLRVVLDRSGRTPPSARVRDGGAPTLLLAAEQPAEALTELYRRDVRMVLVEGGPTVASAFLAAGLVDRIVGYLAPVLLGGDGLAVLPGVHVPTLAAAGRWQLYDVARCGPDVRVELDPEPTGPGRVEG